MMTKAIKVTILTLVLLLILHSCTTTGGFQKATFEDKTFKDLDIYGMLDNDFTSTYFGSMKFVVQNNYEKWMHITDIQLVFPDDSANKYIHVLDSRDLGLWGKAIVSQKDLHQTAVKDIQSSLIDAGSSLSSMIGDVSQTIGMSPDDQKRGYPSNHLYEKDFILPPGFSVEKWVLLNSTHHEKIPYLSDISIKFNADGRDLKANLKFRKNSHDYDHFNWMDPNRKADNDFYLGVTAGVAFPSGDFKEHALKSSKLINIFGVNGYLAIYDNFGLNFELDYKSFPSRGKLPFEVDSLRLLGMKFEFGDWDIFSLSVSPRFAVNLNRDIDLFAELMGGISLSTSPVIRIKEAGIEIYEIKSVSAFSFFGGFSAGSRFYLTDKLNLDIKLEFTPFMESTFKYITLLDKEIEVSYQLSHFQIKGSLFWLL